MTTLVTKTRFKREVWERILEREEGQLLRFTLVLISFLLSKDNSGEGGWTDGSEGESSSTLVEDPGSILSSHMAAHDGS